MARSAQGACLLFALTTSACGASGPADSPVSPDAAAPVPVDAGEAGAGDADAAVGDAASIGYCASTGPHYFCDDFDEDPLAHDWDDVTTQHGALTLDEARATSRPYALLASSPAIPTGAVTTAALGKQIVDTPPHLHLAFDFAADALDPSGAAATVLVVDLLASDGSIAEVLALSVQISGGTLLDTDGAAFVSSHPFAWPALSTGAWTRVQLDVAYADDGNDGDDSGILGGTVSLSLDGQTVIDSAPMAPSAQPSLPLLQLGLVSLPGPSAAVAVRVDDFTFATLP